MALHPQLIASDAVFSNTTSHVVTTSDDVFDGESILVIICSGEQGVGPEPTVTDSSGNTYVRRQAVPAGWPFASEGSISSVNLGTYEALNCLALPSGSSITVSVVHTFAPPEIAHIVQVVRLRGIKPAETGGNSDNGHVSATPGHSFTLGSFPISPGGGALIIGCAAWTYYAGDTPALDSSFTVLDDASTATGRTLASDGLSGSVESRDRRCIVGWKIAASGTYSGSVGTVGNVPYTWSAFIVTFEGGFSNPWNLETRAGQYHYAAEQAGDISYWFSFASRPSGVLGPFVLPGGGSDTHFRMCEEAVPPSRVRGVWARGVAVVASPSDDEGQTWDTPVTLWGTAKNPTVAHDARAQKTIYLAFVTDHLEGRVQGPGDSSPGTAFTLRDGSGTALPVDSGTSFHIQPAADTPDRWFLVLVRGGAVKNYLSTDDGPTWAVA